MSNEHAVDGALPRPGRGRSEIVVFGRRSVFEALASQGATVSAVRVARPTPADFRKRLAHACREADVPLESVGYPGVAEWSGEPRHDQGVVARVRLEHLMEVESFIDAGKGAAARHPARLVALDGVTNPQNVGMIVRSIVAAGMQGILWPLRGSPWVSGLVIKASASALYDCPILRCDTLIQGIHTLQASGFQCVSLAADAEASLFDFCPPHRAVFVVGGETGGVSPEVEALADARISIPMHGGVDSLNVAVAASLVCFHAGRQARA